MDLGASEAPDWEGGYLWVGAPHKLERLSSAQLSEWNSELIWLVWPETGIIKKKNYTFLIICITVLQKTKPSPALWNSSP